MEEQEKSYLNKDLSIPKEEFFESINNDFISSDFESQLEWSMLILNEHPIKQIRQSNALIDIHSLNYFDNCFLMASGVSEINNKLGFFMPFGEMQANPRIFPNINIKILSITDTISLKKIRELPNNLKHQLGYKNAQYLYEYGYAFYKKDTECFYAQRMGYQLNDKFFKHSLQELANLGATISIEFIPKLCSLHPNYYYSNDAILNHDALTDAIRTLSFSYQIALSMYYEWTIKVKENNGIGIILPISPNILKEMFTTSLSKIESRKRLIHFVRDHYRRKIVADSNDYSIYIKSYLRGENKFSHNGFDIEVIPPKYDLNRAKTKKKFLNPIYE